MKKKPVWKESLRLYKKNFGSLLLALLVQLVLRAIALSPLMFLADKQYAAVAYAAIPLYLLIVLPARQNFALALQEVLSGGSVFTTQLICPKQYGVKLWRGVKGMIRILLWSVVTIVSAVLLYKQMGAAHALLFAPNEEILDAMRALKNAREKSADEQENA